MTHWWSISIYSVWYRFHYSSSSNNNNYISVLRYTTIFIRLRSATIQNTFHRFYFQVRFFLSSPSLPHRFFSPAALKVQNSQNNPKKKHTGAESLLNINFNSLELCCCYAGRMYAHSFRMQCFTSAMNLSAKFRTWKKRSHFNSRSNWMIPFFFLSSFFLKCAVQHIEVEARVLLENHKKT